MSYSILFNPEAIADLAKIDRPIQLESRRYRWLGFEVSGAGGLTLFRRWVSDNSCNIFSKSCEVFGVKGQ